MEIMNLILIIYGVNIFIGEAMCFYTLLNGTRRSVESDCKNQNGNITVFQDFTSKELNKVLNGSGSIKIWNGYQYTTGWIENTGCFHKIRHIGGHVIRIPDITIPYCIHYCKRQYAYTKFALKESECLCIAPDRNVPDYFNATDEYHCTNKCNRRWDELCGSKMESAFYNIYIAKETQFNVTGNNSCLLYKWNKDMGVTKQKNCNKNLTSGFIACRSNSTAYVVKTIKSSPLTWTSSLKMCLMNNANLVSYSDVQQTTFSSTGKFWLNERNYTTTVEMENHGEELEMCQIISKNKSGSIEHVVKSCDSDEFSTAKYFCKTGEFDEEGTTSTITYSQSRYPSPASQTSKVETTNGMMSKELSTTTSNSFRNAPIDAQNTDDGSVIGGAIGALVVVIVIGTVIIILIVRKRQTGSRKEESEYQSQRVNYSKCNGLTNKAYCSEATLNIIKGNPDRISQEYTTIKDEFRNSQEYTTIQDEKLQNIRVSNSESDTFENKNQSSPTNGPLYMVLEETHSKSEINDPSNYELAQPICDKEENENASLQTEGREQKEEAMDYDHLRQEAYKQNMGEENVYNHAETDNDYSHISQVTKTNKNHIDDDDDDNDYDHTGNVQNHELTSNTGNDQDDTYAHTGGDGRTVDDQTDDDDDDDYAHTQTKENHHQTSIKRIDQDDTYAHAGGNGTTADGMRDIGPYDLAQNVRRPDEDSKEYSDNIRGIGSYEVAHNVNRPDVDDQESSNDMREIGPYEFAHNIDRRENGTTESTQDTFVQLGTEEGNYSLAEPIDMNSGHYE